MTARIVARVIESDWLDPRGGTLTDQEPSPYGANAPLLLARIHFDQYQQFRVDIFVLIQIPSPVTRTVSV